MGYDTKFYGKLEFMRSLTLAELLLVEEVLDKPEELGSKAYREYLDEADRSGRKWDNDRDNEAMRQVSLRALQAAGFVRIEDQGNASDLSISRDGDGLVYGSEKSYNMVSGVNFIIANARLRIPDFGLKGQLYASTEFEPYQWLLKINEDGWAEQVPCKFKELPSDAKRVIEWGQEQEQRCWKASVDRMEAEESKREYRPNLRQRVRQALRVVAG